MPLSDKFVDSFDPYAPVQAASEPSMGAIPSVLIAGVVAAIIFYLASPKGRVTTPSDIGRKWFSWAAVVICLAILPNYIRDTSDDVVLVKWVIDMVFFGGGAFLLGLAYGKFFKKWETAPSSASNSEPAPPTSAHSSGDIKPAPRAEPAITAPSAPQVASQAMPLTPPPAMTKAAQQPTTNAHPQGSPASSTPPEVNVDHIYAQVAKEIESGNPDKGLWTRLWAECDGDDKKTKVIYIKQRANVLIATEKARLLEEQLRLIKVKRQRDTETELAFERQDKEVAFLSVLNQLNIQGYRTTKDSFAGWVIREPLGGRVKLGSNDELLNYAVGRVDIPTILRVKQ